MQNQTQTPQTQQTETQQKQQPQQQQLMEMENVKVNVAVEHSTSLYDGNSNYDYSYIKVAAVACVDDAEYSDSDRNNKKICFAEAKYTTVYLDEDDTSEFDDVMEIYKEVVTTAKKRYDNFITKRAALFAALKALGANIKEKIS